MSYPFDPFAEVAQLQRTECRNGLSYKDLAVTAHKVYRRVAGMEPIPLQDADLAPWEAAAAKAAQIIDLPESEMATIEISAKGLAKALYNQYTVERDKNPDWESVSEEHSGWEAVGRHLANLIDSDGQAIDFVELEDRIVQMFRERVNARTLVLS